MGSASIGRIENLVRVPVYVRPVRSILTFRIVLWYGFVYVCVYVCAYVRVDACVCVVQSYHSKHALRASSLSHTLQYVKIMGNKYVIMNNNGK